MQLNLPQYSGKDYLVLALIIIPFTIVMNSAIFGSLYFDSWSVFLPATLITGIAFSIDFILCGGIAVLLKYRFPFERQVGKRLTLMILSFLFLTGLFLLLIFNGYEWIHFHNYRFNRTGFIWAYIGMGIVNIFLTFLHEAISRYENWKSSFNETEALRKTYRESQMLGLKSQVNPHFLFNSLNSLSSLISEDEEEAEKFLDELTKVYRYMLRNDEEQLVTFDTELKFIQSYFYLLQSRYGDGIRLRIEVDEEMMSRWIPPLTLQVIVENAFTQNSMSRSNPLEIFICSFGRDKIKVTNNVQPKLVTETSDFESGLDNLVTKFRLLNEPPVIIRENEKERTILLPLITKEKEVVL